MPGLSEEMNVAIGVQMLIVAIVSLVVGLILGGNLACSSVAKYLKKAQDKGKSLNDVISYLEGNEEETDE
jgi:ABC-type siderophore export system fused ATPase/permease subunit